MSADPTQAVIARPPDRTPLIKRDPLDLAKQLYASGYFKDVESMAQTVVKIVAGEELGLGPVTSMQGVHIIEGKPSLSANLLGTLVKRTERYNFRPKEVTAERAEIEFFENGESIGTSEFTIEQASRAGLVRKGSGWEKYPEAMLFARALSQGVRWYCPEVTAGSPAYTPEELGADVDQTGEPIYVEPEVEKPEAPTPALDPETVDQLSKGYEAVKPQLEENAVNALDGLNVRLGSLGIDGFGPNESVEEQFAKLKPEQAEALNADLYKLADARAGEGEPNAD